ILSSTSATFDSYTISLHDALPIFGAENTDHGPPPPTAVRRLFSVRTRSVPGGGAGLAIYSLAHRRLARRDGSRPVGGGCLPRRARGTERRSSHEPGESVRLASAGRAPSRDEAFGRGRSRIGPRGPGDGPEP